MDDSEGKVDIEQCLAAGETVQLPIRGWSMYPLLHDGRDQVIVAPAAEAKALRRGDVALYRRDGGVLVLHRVCRVGAEGFYCVGDNQTAIEGPLRFDQLRGVLAAVIRDGRRIGTTDARYRAFSSLWLLALPLRPALSRAVHRLKQRRNP